MVLVSEMSTTSLLFYGKASQVFGMVEGQLQFRYTKLLFMIGNDIYIGKTRERVPTGTMGSVNFRTAYDILQIPKEVYCPPASKMLKLAPNALSADYYVKRPNLTLFGDHEGINLNDLVYRDISASETLGRIPHPNIAQYYGCLVQDGRVTGICFKRYPRTLMAYVNPAALNKEEFMKTNSDARARAATRYLTGIAEGIKEIHKYGLVHNDINPENIMIDEQDNPIIIDFDSCLPTNSSLEKTKRTFGWYDSRVDKAKEENDWRSWKEMETWLTGSSPAEYQFCY